MATSCLSAATVDLVQFSKSPSDNSCNPGAPATEFLTTDPRVYLHVDLSAVAANDRIQVEWVRPGGQVFTQTQVVTFDSPGEWCYTANLQIAGTQAATLPGTWTANGIYNNAFCSRVPST